MVNCLCQIVKEHCGERAIRDSMMCEMAPTVASAVKGDGWRLPPIREHPRSIVSAILDIACARLLSTSGAPASASTNHILAKVGSSSMR